MAQSTANHPWTVSLCRLAGYGLLAIALINLFDALIPFYISDSNWRYGTIGILIERMPVTLVGFVLVFWGGSEYRNRWERMLIKGLSWSSLGIGILFLLIIPLLLRTGMTLDQQAMNQINTQYRQQIKQLDQIEQQLTQAPEAQLNTFITALKSQNPSFTITNPKSLRQQVAVEAGKARKTALANSQSQKTAQRLTLRKTVLKWNLTALVSAFLFFSVWRMTQWTRSHKVLAAMVQAKG
ncbi:MAG: YdgA family protein [Oculatellaceae cyanobacterium Prado106]|jgi:hypothetical protein|nr:YdgA family protein [Oculatellaceae cyanobacterium Prado106]